MQPGVEERTQTVPGLGAPVVIERDGLGVPHIWAETAEDAFFGQGYAQAADRLWQMERDRRQVYGTWAAVAGPSAVSGDMLARKLRIAWLTERDFAALDARTQAMFRAYAAGVNAWIAQASVLPEPFLRHGVSPAPWQPQDGLAVFIQRHLAMGGWESKAWRGWLLAAKGPEAVARWYAPLGLPEWTIAAPGVRTDAAGEAELLKQVRADLGALVRTRGQDASNNWVVAGSRTRSGLPLLAGDPHRILEVPNVYYQNHIACPDFDAIGISMPGVPGIHHFGHNAEVAWSITHGMADTGDFFLEERDAMEVVHRERQEIEVLGGDPVAVDVVWTAAGAVVGEGADGRSALTLRLPELVETNTTARAFLPMLESRSVAEMEEAVRPWLAPVQNMVMADRKGTIAYRTRGRVPIRHELNRLVPVPFADERYRWQGLVPFEGMPRVENPATGWIATANNRIEAPGDPVYISNQYAAGHRIGRLAELLSAGTDLTIEDMARIHADYHSLAAEEALALLPRVAPLTDAGREALALLGDWNGDMDMDLAAPLVYSAWREALVTELLGDLTAGAAGLSSLAQTGAPTIAATLRAHVWTLAATDHARLLPEGATWDGLLAKALDRALADLQAAHGPDMGSWRWGDMHRLPPGAATGGDGPFGFAMHGDNDTVRVGSYLHQTEFTVRSGSVARYAFDTADWERSGWSLPHGEGGDAGHPHFADQVDAWKEARLLPMPYGREAVARACVSRTELRPDGRA